MVQRKIDFCTPVVRKRDISLVKWVPVLLLFVVVVGAMLGALIATSKLGGEIASATVEQAEEAAEDIVPVPMTNDDKPTKIDFQSVVDAWATTMSGARSALVYDLDRDEVVGQYNASVSYATASLYKLFVVYEGYRRVQSGEWKRDDPAGYTGNTIIRCLDLAIRESNSECGETLWSYIGRNELDQIIENDFGITNSTISVLLSNPQDVAKMMQVYYKHKDVTDEDLVTQMKDSFLNQPMTEYDWRQGLPKGFRVANVYNKVGWDYDPDESIWKIYHDAAIIEYPEQNRHFVVVVMTNKVSPRNITDLGSRIEAEYLRANS